MTEFSDKALQVNVAFVVDVTGSMTPYLQSIKEQIRAAVGPNGVADMIKQEEPMVDVQMRYALLAYRDVADKQNSISILNFTKDANQVIAMVSGASWLWDLICLRHVVSEMLLGSLSGLIQGA